MKIENISHLIIPDCHVISKENLNRFTALGNLIADLKPSKVICLGDFADMQSLNSHEEFQNCYYKDDIDAAIKAQELLLAPLKARKKKLPKFFMLEGNHEYRIKRWIKDYSVLEGKISPSDLQYKEHKWEYIEYDGYEPGILQLDGIAYSHYFTHNNSSNAISGKYHSSNLIQKLHKSATAGHSHLFSYSTEVTAEHKRLHGLVAGCYFPGFKNYAGQGNKQFRKGVIFKQFLNHGDYDLTWISMERILKNV
jgi:hypothetical protein